MRLPGINEEALEVTKRTGYYIHPYEWGEMMKMASRILTMLTAPAATTMTYRRALIILDIVSGTIRKMLGETEG